MRSSKILYYHWVFILDLFDLIIVIRIMINEEIDLCEHIPESINENWPHPQML